MERLTKDKKMRKRVRLIKRMLAILLVVLMSINGFAAVVSDNDGSAFITKAEFDLLKQSFQGQIDSYNTSIDAKIDGAIAQYLCGITIVNKEKHPVVAGHLKEVTIFGKDNVPQYAYGRLGLDYEIEYIRMDPEIGRLTAFNDGEGSWAGGFAQICLSNLEYYCRMKCVATPSKKMLITEETKVGVNWLGCWYGFAENVIESLSGFMFQLIDDYVSGNDTNYLNGLIWTANPTSHNFAIDTSLFKYFFARDKTRDGELDAPLPPYWAANGVTREYGDIKYHNIVLYDDGNYACNATLKDSNMYLQTQRAFTESRSEWRSAVSIPSGAKNRQFAVWLNSNGTWKKTSGIVVTNKIHNPPISSTYDNSLCAPQFGFSTNVTKWNQLYSGELNGLQYTSGGYVQYLEYPLLIGGLPLIQAKKGFKLEYNLSFSDTDDYYVYLHYGPFNGTPVEDECIEVNYLDEQGEVVQGKKVLVKGGKGLVFWEDQANTDLVYVKWTKVGENGSGTILLTGDSNSVTFEKLK